jgi:hypothetical protein
MAQTAKPEAGKATDTARDATDKLAEQGVIPSGSCACSFPGCGAVASILLSYQPP